MRDFGDHAFENLLKKFNEEDILIESQIPSTQFGNLKYFLIRKFYYAIILDDYPFKIIDKQSLLEALYYQMRLITVHDLNWDAFEEGFQDFLKNTQDFDGICVLLKDCNVRTDLGKEFDVFTCILNEIGNAQNRKIKIILAQ